ncbi:hypothetical protein I3843_05G073300 [Carya illinoinensis]|uniref:Plant heme peroxidase family profile domain-containing protein n=1 Tax=Carya illinoinensis TaxID=32201 RepID=A0A922F118_CARIL|nr:hypothetical protein I3842_05G079600 [Carya illinoinensis]KAG7978209.1 hypothetical protein I3843_05G073300 [Carya illinoinensis]
MALPVVDTEYLRRSTRLVAISVPSSPPGSALPSCFAWQEVKSKHPKFTYADLYQLVAVEVTGGPTIDFVPGRQDSNVCPKEGRLPDAKQGSPHLKDIFYRMGLSDKDIVALSGGHNLVLLSSCFHLYAVFFGNGTRDYTIPLLCCCGEGHIQRDMVLMVLGLRNLLSLITHTLWNFWRGESEGLLRLPTDKALVDDPNFRHYVELYAKEEEAFFRDHAESHKKLSELGFTPSSSGSKVNFKGEQQHTGSKCCWSCGCCSCGDLELLH